MITSLTINNIALISHLSLEFEGGLTVLSGETGSGKSIIIDSLAFVLGERADKSMIKHGCDKASVEVCFDIDVNGNTAKVLESLNFEVEDTLIIKRTLTLAGKNNCSVNGSSCSTSMLKQITATLVDIFGQSQHLNLLKVDKHIEVLDGFCNFGSNKEKIAEQHKLLREVTKKLSQFGGSSAERDRQLDILDFQINELTEANLSVDEELQLQSTHTRIVNMQRIVDALTVASNLLGGDESSLGNLSVASDSLLTIAKYDDRADQLAERINSSVIELTDVASTVEDFLAECNFDYNEVERVNNRIEEINAIKRKYGGTVEDALKFLADITTQHETLANATELIANLTVEKNNVIAKMFDLSKKISLERKKCAKIFSKNIENQLAELGMKSTTFEVQFSNEPTLEGYSSMISSNGFDKVEFLLSANAGEPVKPLAKVISGGEMSRFMLAIKNITATIENIPTMVFDEIDTGISGNVGQMVANKLAKVSRNYQCLVITHLPQIVAIADNNLLINKCEVDGKTVSTVTNISCDSEKSQEVARLLGGINELSLANASDMISRAKQYKTTI